MTNTFVIKNGTAYTESGIVDNATLVIEGKVIKSIRGNDVTLENFRIIDAKGGLICPGFIDIHINGGGRTLTMDGTYDAICKMAKAHASFGTTAMLPTTVAWSDEEQIAAIKAVTEAMQRGTGGAKPLGIHMEGPFLNPAKGGAHNPKYLVQPSISKFDMFYEASEGNIKLITLSPELPGAIELIKYITGKGVVVSAGHTEATYEQTLEAIEAGVKLCAHIFNAMGAVKAREPGAVIAMLSSKKTMVEIITDGVHLHPSLVNFIIDHKGLEEVIIVTDATPPSGTNDKEWILEGTKVIIKGYTGYLENGSIVGSALTMGSAVKVTKEITNLPLEKILLMSSYNPARLLGLEQRKGSLAEGKDADITLLSSDDLDVQMTVVEGEIVYQKD